MPAQVQDIYDFAVSTEHGTGDIWAGLSCLGLLGRTPISGIVITPSCDLSNRKVETITYLPVVPIHRYFTLPIFRPHLLRPFNDALRSLNLEPINAANNLAALTDETVASYGAQIDAAAPALATQKARAALELLNEAASSKPANTTSSLLSQLLGTSKMEELLKSVVTNSFRSDIHFLPYDRQSESFSAVPCHSVVLFRYPITVPIVLLDTANESAATSWQECCNSLEASFPVSSSFQSCLPQKRSRVRTHFMADLLTRYLGLYLRFGSPDFDPRQVSQFVAELCNP